MIRKGLAILLALALMGVGALAEGAVLTVKGEGSVSLSADTATISLGIRKYAADVKDAQQAVNRNMESVIAALTGAGVDKDDIYTNSISIYPEYDYSDDGEDEDEDENAHIKGYNASNSITIVTRDMENVGAFIDAAFDAGANTLDDVSFSASDTAEAADQALVLAIQDARAKAETMAGAAGMAVGKVLAIGEGDGYSYSAPVRMAKSLAVNTEEAADTQVFASKQSVTASVIMQFELTEK